MKWRPFFVAAAALALAGCASFGSGLLGGVGQPSAIADQTTLDERLMLGADLGYKAARKAVLAVDDHAPLDAATARRFKKIDKKIFDGLERATRAYAAANSVSYAAALAEINPLITELWSLAVSKGEPK